MACIDHLQTNTSPSETTTLRRNDDGECLAFTREQEQVFACVFDSLCEFYRQCDPDHLKTNQWRDGVCRNAESSEDVRYFSTYISDNPDLIEEVFRGDEKPIDVFFPALSSHHPHRGN